MAAPNPDLDLTSRPEHFIPYLRQDLVQMCVDDGRLSPEDQQQFKDFCEIFSAWTHHRYHQRQETIKYHYAPFDPDRETKLDHLGDSAIKEYEGRVFESFRVLCQDANFRELTPEDLERAFNAQQLIQLNTKVDLDDFDQFAFFARGDAIKPGKLKKLFGSKEVQVNVWQRVIVLLKFKARSYFENTKSKRKWLKNTNFQPGKMYAYAYKDVPQLDLELLFPNVEVKMTAKDKLFLIVPAVGGGVGVLVKSAGLITLIVAAALYYTAGREWANKLGVAEEAITNVMPVLTALLLLLIALGGLAFKQWSNYRNKRIQFLKDVSENLFFRNLATNQSVFHRVIDNAEEEECKEAILVYYHLLANPDRAFTAPELDGEIERWFKKRFSVDVDFDIDDPIGDLQGVKGNIRPGVMGSLLSVDAAGKVTCLSLPDAKALLDDLWDHTYEFGQA